jgi:16S rRNA (guanine(1405)-N(7))-methyltransferase
MADAGRDPDPIVAQVLAASKYRGLDPAFVARVVAEVRPTVRTDAEAVKATKRRLHQAFGAFTGGKPVAALARAREALAADPADDPPDDAAVRAALVAAMRAHASTAERVPHLDEVAALLEGWVGAPASVVDLGCGLGPLATPWLATATGCRWWCCDVDRGLVDGLAALGPWLPVELTAEPVDLVATTVDRPADLALALKVVTTLDQQRPGRSAEVLAALRCADVVVSVPRGSLGGGRRYADPLDTVRRTAEVAGLDLVADAAVGVEHYVHLRPSGGAS